MRQRQQHRQRAARPRPAARARSTTGLLPQRSRSRPGRSYDGKTQDYGFSGQIDWDFGGVKLTSITAYRDYNSDQGSDTDYSTVDILYSAADGNSSRQFKTFTQELRLQRHAVRRQARLAGRRLLRRREAARARQPAVRQPVRPLRDLPHHLGRRPGGLYSPTSPGCVAPGRRPPATLLGAAGIATDVGAALVAAFDGSTASTTGSTLDRYRQNSRNFAASRTTSSMSPTRSI